MTKFTCTLLITVKWIYVIGACETCSQVNGGGALMQRGRLNLLPGASIGQSVRSQGKAHLESAVRQEHDVKSAAPHNLNRDLNLHAASAANSDQGDGKTKKSSAKLSEKGASSFGARGLGVARSKQHRQSPLAMPFASQRRPTPPGPASLVNILAPKHAYEVNLQISGVDHTVQGGSQYGISQVSMNDPQVGDDLARVVGIARAIKLDDGDENSIRRGQLQVETKQQVTVEEPQDYKTNDWKGALADDARDRDNSKGRHKLIPAQLIMTGQFSSLQELPKEAMENLNKTRALNLGLTVRYFSDGACFHYLGTHFANLLRFYVGERRGSFRGDLCRSAVLLKEGGFYADLDFEFHAPFTKLIDDGTTFMSAMDYVAKEDSFILNALIAVRPNSPIMQLTLSNMEKWYSGNHAGLLGPTAMTQAISQIMHRDCPGVPLPYQDNDRGHVACGVEHMIFYREVALGSGQACAQLGSVVCPKRRETSDFWGTRIGVFSIGKEYAEKRLIGWPRYSACSILGCNINGGVTFVQK